MIYNNEKMEDNKYTEEQYNKYFKKIVERLHNDTIHKCNNNNELSDYFSSQFHNGKELNKSFTYLYNILNIDVDKYNKSYKHICDENSLIFNYNYENHHKILGCLLDKYENEYSDEYKKYNTVS